jgi:hypothetical protein
MWYRRRYSPVLVEVEYQKSAAAWYSTLNLSVEVATVNLHGVRSCSVRDASRERRERKVRAVRQKASGVEAWRRRAVSSLASVAVEIDDDVEEARRVRAGSSTEAATGEAGPSKRRRSTTSAPHSSAPEQLPLSVNAPARYVSPACYDLHLDLHVVAVVVGAVVAAVSWPAMTLFMALHCLFAILHGVVAVDVPLVVPEVVSLPPAP